MTSDYMYYWSCGDCLTDFYTTGDVMTSHMKEHNVVVLWVYPRLIPVWHRVYIAGVLGGMGILIILLSLWLWVIKK